MSAVSVERIAPVALHGSNMSYFTGKLENYFKVRGIDYQLHSMVLPDDVKRIQQKLGVWQMPILQLADGRWMTDTTKIIQWFELAVPDNPVVPADPLQAIFKQRSFLLGERPSLADIGFSAPFFRHFALDPVPLEIIRQHAPAVLE